MVAGPVKWFDPRKGYGFIQPQGAAKDIFVPISAVEQAGLSFLNEGQSVEYEIVSNRLGLTQQQLDVLKLMMQGKSNEEICRKLGLSEPMVKNFICRNSHGVEEIRARAVVTGCRPCCTA